MAEAAALPLVGITAWEALFDRLHITAGQTVLTLGGAGGVGHIAVQLANAHGALVYATVSGAEKAKLVADLGAEPIDRFKETPAAYVERLTGGRGFDAVFDTVGGENIVSAFESAKLNGQVATTVSIATIDLTLAHVRSLSLHVVYMLIPMIHDVGRERHGEILRGLASLADGGELRPVIERVYPLAHVADAHRHVESGQAVGKVVVSVDD
jgi:NADPH:quinone reductase-like Zn-dependent oxidoreductase